MNFLRNVALTNVFTKYVFITDIDFMPSPDLHGKLEHYLKHGTGFKAERRVGYPRNVLNVSLDIAACLQIRVTQYWFIFVFFKKYLNISNNIVIIIIIYIMMS